MLGSLCFTVFGLVALLCACGVVVARHPLSAAINLIGVMLSLAGLYALLDSPFLAVVQVLVYAGAIMMLVVFVIMVLNQAREHRIPRFDWFSLAGIGLALAFLAVLMQAGTQSAQRDPAAVAGSVAPIAGALFTTGVGSHGWYLLFELVGVILLVAIVAAVLLAKRKLDTPTESAPHSDAVASDAPAAPADSHHAAAPEAPAHAP